MVADCSGWIEPLNLECMLVNTFAGSIDLFVMVALIAIAAIGAKFRMLNMTMLVMFALFAITMQRYFSELYFLVILVAGLVISYGISRIAKS